ncbi:MAG: GNAT family N-acetyltransferase [Bacteriovoracaceae bacterium]|jgi:aminoglycoside 6'-N-acetyltransferase I|nr:GNAT family N-acetyltransferase [Bacteriovoracaceae bacterium]
MSEITQIPVLIKKASLENIPEWGKARCLLWPSDDLEGHLSELTDLMNSDNFISFIAFNSSDQICGFLEASVRNYVNGCEHSPVLFLGGIWVQGDAQRQGIGRQLLIELEGYAKSKGFKEIGSDCSLDNLDSQAAHKGWGFSETERVVYFRKDLSSN